jgi:hypothetical protein
MTKDEALRLALEALENWFEFDPENFGEVDKKAITAIKAALANEALERKAENARELGLDYEPIEAKDKPWEKFCDSNCVWTDHHPDCKLAKDEPVATLEDLEQEIYENTRQFVSFDVMEWMLKRYYTTSPQRTWIGLTGEDEIDWEEGGNLRDLVKAIEAKLKEKNT